MGNWTIIIQGTGQHHNDASPHDADVLAPQLARQMRDAGHEVTTCTITTGYRQDLGGIYVRPGNTVGMEYAAGSEPPIE